MLVIRGLILAIVGGIVGLLIGTVAAYMIASTLGLLVNGGTSVVLGLAAQLFCTLGCAALGWHYGSGRARPRVSG